MPIKIRITDLQDYAVARGGKCLSEKHEGFNDKINWECKEGHQWVQSFSSIKTRKNWCLKCLRSKKWQPKLDELKAFAISKGGKCLTEKYIDKSFKLMFECAKGHQWNVVPINIYTDKSWCPECNRMKNVTLEHLNNLAEPHGCICLTTGKINSRTLFEWKCKEGHTWKATLKTIRKGGWCPICAKRKRGRISKYNFEYIIQYAKERGGLLLSNEIINTTTPLLWECKEGHQWNSKLANMFYQQSWCPYCPRWNKLTLQNVIDRAILHGEICLSKEYKNSSTLMDFQCSKGHEYSSSVDRMTKGLWCPVCLKENRVRKKYKVKG